MVRFQDQSFHFKNCTSISQHVTTVIHLIFQISNFASPPAWMSRYAPFLSVAMTEHSMCHPGWNPKSIPRPCGPFNQQMTPMKNMKKRWRGWPGLPGPHLLGQAGSPGFDFLGGSKGHPGRVIWISGSRYCKTAVATRGSSRVRSHSDFSSHHLPPEHLHLPPSPGKTGCKTMILVWSWFEGQGFSSPNPWSNYSFCIFLIHFMDRQVRFNHHDAFFISRLGCRMEVRHELPGGFSWMLPSAGPSPPQRLPCL